MAAEQETLIAHEMHLTCEKCATTYRLDPVLLGPQGRVVRCMQCMAMWTQLPPEGLFPPAEISAAAAPVEAETARFGRALPMGDGDAVLPDTHYGLEEDMRVIPEAVMPEAVIPEPLKQREPLQIPVLTHRPMGMEAGQFGLFTFLLLCFVSASALLLAKQALVRSYPPLFAVYHALHIPVGAPGEGLSVSAMTAESHVEGAAKTLRIEAKLANISDHTAAWPKLHIRVSDAGGASLKEWDLAGKDLLDARGADKDAKTDAKDTPDTAKDGSRNLSAGETVPVKLSFDNPPAGGKTAELTVSGN